MKLVPDSFEVPLRYETPDFVIRPLMVSDTKLDYEAVMSSIDIIKETRGGDWPSPEMTIVEDEKDLVWHEEEFRNRTSFAYTVMNTDETKCLGCLYLYPPGFRDAESKNGDVDVSFWVTQGAYNQGLYPKLFKVLDTWLKTEWAFKAVVYTNKVLPSH